MPLPRLKTALSGNLQALEKNFLDNKDGIEIWFRKAFNLTKAPFYTSVDIRNAGYKIAPVDTNLYPAGFNNLHPDLKLLSANAIQVAISRTCPDTDSVIIIPENHTRNQSYFEHLKILESLVKLAGYPVRIMSINPEITSIQKIMVQGDNELLIYPLAKKSNHLQFDDQVPCAIILNNDLSGGIPDSLKNLKQNILPHSGMGWFQRKKSTHFDHYRNIIEQFSQDFGFEQWHLLPQHKKISVNLANRDSAELIENTVAELLADIQQQYNNRGIKDKPFVAIKSNNGTYGMGIIMVKSVAEVISLNRKQRKKLNSNKEGLAVSELLIQEGVYALETINNAIAEPVVYMIDQFVVGSFYRVHKDKSVTDNLNAPGMYFDPLPIENPCPSPPCPEGYATVNRFYTYSVIARLANLASAYELEDSMAQQ